MNYDTSKTSIETGDRVKHSHHEAFGRVVGKEWSGAYHSVDSVVAVDTDVSPTPLRMTLASFAEMWDFIPMGEPEEDPDPNDIRVGDVHYVESSGGKYVIKEVQEDVLTLGPKGVFAARKDQLENAIEAGHVTVVRPSEVEG